jgi:hypothetical protein
MDCRRQQGARLRERRAVPLDATIGLLEHEARVDGQGPVPPVAVAQEAHQDQHALAVDGAAQADLALDVHDLAISKPHRRGDPRRAPERDLAQRHDGQPVGDTHGLPAGRDQHRAASDLLQRPLMEARRPPPLRLDGPVGVLRRHAVAPRLDRPVGRLAQQVRQPAHMGREPLGVARQTRGVVDDGGDGRRLQRRHAGPRAWRATPSGSRRTCAA